MIDTSTYLGALRALAARAPAIAVRRWYPPRRLAELLYVDLSPRNDCVSLDLGPSPNARMNLQLINLAPFKCEIEKAQFTLCCAGASINFAYLKRHALAPATPETIYLTQSLTEGQANQIRSNIASSATWLEGTLDANSPLHQFTKHLGTLSGVRVHAYNAHVPRGA
jgi:hypothetical protein